MEFFQSFINAKKKVSPWTCRRRSCQCSPGPIPAPSGCHSGPCSDRRTRVADSKGRRNLYKKLWNKIFFVFCGS